MAENKTLIIIDGNSLINRAYYAMQKPMITREGIYTHGIYGFINMLTKLIKDHEPGYMAVTFDVKAPTFRHKEYDGYKATRKGMPPELSMQMPLLKEVLDAMNIRRLELEGFEGDDLIGTLAVRGEEAGLEPLIVTGDRDALQLSTKKTKVLITRRGISEFELYDEARMQEVYGLTPDQFVDLKGLMGDTSDNIPGIPGVGEKTALKLLADYGSVENLIEHASEIKQEKLRAKVEENADLALLSKKLATINKNVPIDIKIEDLQCREPDYDKLIDIYVKLEFNSFIKRLPVSGSSKAPAADPEKEIAKIEFKAADSSDIEKILAGLSGGKDSEKAPIYIKVFSDGNHKSRPALFGMALGVGETAYFIGESEKEKMGEAARILSEKELPLAGCNLKEDYYALLANFEFEKKGAVFNTAFDAAVAEYVLNPAASDYDMKALSVKYLHEEFKSLEELGENAGQLDMFADSSANYKEFAVLCFSALSAVIASQKAALDAEELAEVAEKLEFPLVEVMASMEKEGFTLKDDVLREIGESITERIEELKKLIYEAAGEEFNISSPKQLGHILFEKMELPAGKKTKSGYSTNAEVLEKLRPDFPIIENILEYRTLTKLKGTYIDGLIPLKAADGKIHAHFQQTVTATGRISCTEPNLQNIPVRQELGRKIRKAFVPSGAGNILVNADYSQIELRILAHLSGEKHLIDAFNNGEDIHRQTAARVFNVPFEEVTPLLRSSAKAVNFGVIYGMSGFGLAEELSITRRDAEKYIKDYFEKYPDVKKYMDEQKENARATGYAKTMLGRRRAIPELSASNFMVRQLGERLAMNTPIQGTAADIIKLAMISTYGVLRKAGMKTKLILQVHDELVLDVPQEELEKAKKLLTDCMENVMQLSVALTCDANEGSDWYSLK